MEGILFQKTLLRIVLQSRSQGKDTVGGDRQQRVEVGVFRSSCKRLEQERRLNCICVREDTGVSCTKVVKKEIILLWVGSKYG